MATARKKTPVEKSAVKKPATKKTTARKATRKKPATAKKYGAAASRNVGETIAEMKAGTLRSGSGQKVTSRKQAIAIGLSEARKRGAKVPDPPKEER